MTDRAARPTLLDRYQQSPFGRVLKFADFRLLWVGAFISFTGSWVQNVAQGHYVFEMTKDEAKLAFVSFAGSIPVFALGLVAGSLADLWDRRRVLILCQIGFAAGAFTLAWTTYAGTVEYWQIVLVAAILGAISCVEMPVRQSIVSRVVPPDVLPLAVPVQAMTFNVARIFGPALGGILLRYFGVPICYLVNGFSFLYLVRNALAIKADMHAPKLDPQPIFDLVTEGMRYTFRDPRLRTLFILESVTAIFGIAYIPLMPAYVAEELGLGTGVAGDEARKQALGNAYTAVGLGAFLGLLLITNFNQPHHRARAIRFSMWTIAAASLMLSVVSNPWMAYPVLAIMGMATILQFNTTNSLFQILSPERLRGRVLAMHIWSLNGLSPFGVLFFGWLANTTRDSSRIILLDRELHLPFHGVDAALILGGICVGLGAIAATLSKRGLTDLA